MLGGAGLHGGLFAVQARGVLQVLRLKALGHRLHGGALLLALFDELVVNVGDVGNVDHLVALVFQIPAQGVKHDQGPGVADVNVVVHGGAAHVNAVFAGLLGDEFLFFAGEGVENLHTVVLLPARRSGGSALLFMTGKRPENQKRPRPPHTSGAAEGERISRFHFCLSLKVPGNGGGRARLLPAWRGSRRRALGRTSQAAPQRGSQPTAPSLCPARGPDTLPDPIASHISNSYYNGRW